jgi:hypothetical protein
LAGEGQSKRPGKHLWEQGQNGCPPGCSVGASGIVRQPAYTPSTTTMSMMPAFSRNFRAAAYSDEKA